MKVVRGPAAIAEFMAKSKPYSRQYIDRLALSGASDIAKDLNLNRFQRAVVKANLAGLLNRAFRNGQTHPGER